MKHECPNCWSELSEELPRAAYQGLYQTCWTCGWTSIGGSNLDVAASAAKASAIIARRIELSLRRIEQRLQVLESKNFPR